MDQFENTVVPSSDEQDPVAEFLAREQSALAGLDIDNNQIINDNNNDDNNIFNNNNHNDEFNIEQQNNDNFEMINSNGNDNQQQQDVTTNQNDDDDDFGSRFRGPQQPKVESEKIRKWREEQIDMLRKKDEEEEIKKCELREQAKKELEDWYKKHEETLSKTKSTNRNDDKQMKNVANVDKIEPGTEWERIAKLCDFNSKTSKSNKDVSRMRSILLQLKKK